MTDGGASVLKRKAIAKYQAKKALRANVTHAGPPLTEGQAREFVDAAVATAPTHLWRLPPDTAKAAMEMMNETFAAKHRKPKAKPKYDRFKHSGPRG